jgi:RND family efflux transporter MFP subunit
MRNSHQHPDALTNSTTVALARLKAIHSTPSVSRIDTPIVHVPTRVPTTSRRRGLLAAGLALGIAVTGAATVVTLRNVDAASAAHAKVTPELRHVQVVGASRVGGGELTLPATLRPYQTADIFARTSGYLKAWHVDIGDHVVAGQLLAELDTPELDQELLQSEALKLQAEASVAEAVAEHEEAKQQIELAKANVQRADAQLSLAKITYKRNTPLAVTQAISKQELDESQATLQSRQAEVAAAKAELAQQTANLATREAIIRSRQATVANATANVQRLRELQGFQRLVAPFDGVITRRQAEVGMLVTAGTTGQTPLFGLVQQDKLRVQVAVPQSQASQLEIGQQADVFVPERPGQAFTGVIARTAAAVDQQSRTLNVEIELPNSQQQLLPGAYAEVKFMTSEIQKKLRVPASTLLLTSAGTFVAIVDGDSSIRILPVKLGRDHGVNVEVTQGLTGDESLIVNPSDDLSNGQRVTFTTAG